jgi:hypothetical protein
MSKYEAELRRRLRNGEPIEEVACWYLLDCLLQLGDAPNEMSKYEEEFFLGTRWLLPDEDVLSALAITAPDVAEPIDMSKWSDWEVAAVYHLSWLDYTRYRNENYNTLAEFRNRANAKCVTAGVYIVRITEEHRDKLRELLQRYKALPPAERHKFVESLARREEPG